MSEVFGSKHTAIEQPLDAVLSTRPESSGIAETLTPLDIKASVMLKSAGSKIPFWAETAATMVLSEKKVFILDVVRKERTMLGVLEIPECGVVLVQFIILYWKIFRGPLPGARAIHLAWGSMTALLAVNGSILGLSHAKLSIRAAVAKFELGSRQSKPSCGKGALTVPTARLHKLYCGGRPDCFCRICLCHCAGVRPTTYRDKRERCPLIDEPTSSVRSGSDMAGDAGGLTRAVGRLVHGCGIWRR